MRRAARKRAGISGLSLMVLVALATGCAVNSRSLDVLMDSKAASLGDWERRELGGDRMLSVVKYRTAMLLSPAEGLVVKSETDNGMVRVSFSNPLAEERGDERRIGCAVPITSDGYFLTAAHCLEEPKSALVTFAVGDDGAGEVLKSDWRVVWKSPDFRKCDLAIIHAPVRPSQFFTLRDSKSIKAGEPIALTGVSGMGANGPPRSSDAAGKVLSVSEPKGLGSEAVWRSVLHDAPMCPGDSGGPLIDRQGHLVGVNSLTTIRRVGQLLNRRTASGLGYVGESVAPDPEWLIRKIEDDRRSKDR